MALVVCLVTVRTLSTWHNFIITYQSNTIALNLFLVKMSENLIFGTGLLGQPEFVVYILAMLTLLPCL